jgi:hypothetical protein
MKDIMDEERVVLFVANKSFLCELHTEELILNIQVLNMKAESVSLSAHLFASVHYFYL